MPDPALLSSLATHGLLLIHLPGYSHDTFIATNNAPGERSPTLLRRPGGDWIDACARRQRTGPWHEIAVTAPGLATPTRAAMLPERADDWRADDGVMALCKHALDTDNPDRAVGILGLELQAALGTRLSGIALKARPDQNQGQAALNLLLFASRPTASRPAPRRTPRPGAWI